VRELKHQIEAAHKQRQAEQAQQQEHHQQTKKQWDKKVEASNSNAEIVFSLPNNPPRWRNVKSNWRRNDAVHRMPSKSCKTLRYTLKLCLREMPNWRENRESR
jgi:hypothetical protein